MSIRLDRKQLSLHLAYYLDEVGVSVVLGDLAKRVTAIAEKKVWSGELDGANVRQAVKVAAKLRAVASSLRS